MLLKILKMIATSSFLTALECTEFVFSWGSAQDPNEEAFSAPPDPLDGLRDPTSRGRGKGRKKEGETPAPLSQIPGPAPGYAHVFTLLSVASVTLLQHANTRAQINR